MLPTLFKLIIVRTWEPMYLCMARGFYRDFIRFTLPRILNWCQRVALTSIISDGWFYFVLLIDPNNVYNLFS